MKIIYKHSFLVNLYNTSNTPDSTDITAAKLTKVMLENLLDGSNKNLTIDDPTITSINGLGLLKDAETIDISAFGFCN